MTAAIPVCAAGGMTNNGTGNGKGKSEMRGFFAALRMTILFCITVTVKVG
jgi:hypothetical protein